jgi:hypothetical protein
MIGSDGRAPGKSRRRRCSGALVSVGLLGLVGGCHGRGGTTVGTPSAATTPSPTAATHCLAASAKLLAQIAAKAVPDAQVKMKTGAVVKAADSNTSIYFVAANFGIAISGVDHETGVWTVNDLDRPTQIAAVDSWAKQVTTWPAGTAVTPAVNPDDPAVVAATRCLSTPP